MMYPLPYSEGHIECHVKRILLIDILELRRCFTPTRKGYIINAIITKYPPMLIVQNAAYYMINNM